MWDNWVGQSIGPEPDRTDQDQDQITPKVETEDRTECGRSTPDRTDQNRDELA
jgi:hypothetical protein